MTGPDRYGIAADAPGVGEMLEVATYLEKQGVPLDEIRAADDIRALTLLVWRLTFGLDGERIPLADAAASAGIGQDRLRRFLAALGLTSAVGEELTVDDMDVVRLLNDFSNLIGEDQILQLTRVLGEGLSRMAEATADMIRVNVEGPSIGQVTRTEYLELSDVMAREGLPRLAHAMDRVFRYHILRISAQHWALDEGGVTTFTEATVGFADMVGFTAHSGALSPSELANVIDRFENDVSQTIASFGGRVVKFIGDEVLFRFDEPGAACACAQGMLRLAADEAIPDVRIGLAHGKIITRYGDVYGPVVNRAARLVAVAPAGAIVVTPEVADGAPAYTFDACEPVSVKGIDEPVTYLQMR